MITSTIGINGSSGWIFVNPSIADETDMGGVIILSASKVAPPSIAGNTSQGFLLPRTKAYNEKIPPSPLLSARRVMITYFIVVCKVSVQKIRETPPRMTISLIAVLAPIMAFITYSGEVPMSP